MSRQGHLLRSLLLFKDAAFVLAIAGVLILTPGCGKPDIETYPVTGVVRSAGKPVPTGMISFAPIGSGDQINGSIGSDGRFEVQAPAGNYKVAVLAMKSGGSPSTTKENWTKAFSQVSRPLVPPVFGDPETSPLKFSVKASEVNQYEIDIPPPNRRRRR